jgi:hypothetical protein
MNLQKVNKNLLFGVILVLSLSIGFINIAQNVNFKLIIDGGGGGGTLSAPTLNQSPSPDYDNSVDLTWSSVSGASEYWLYRSSSQDGVYSRIAILSSRSYTDTRDLGSYWYKVRAHNTYTTSGYSNPISVLVPNQFNQLYNEGGYIYSPTKSFIYSSDYDDAVVSINVKQDTDDQGNAVDNHPWFSPTITVTLNPDQDEPRSGHTKFYYIDSFKLAWTLIDPNGNNLDYENIEVILTKYFSLDGINQRTEMNRLVDLVLAFYSLLPYGSYAELLKALIVPSYVDSTFTDGHDTDYDFWVKWKEGYYPVGNGFYGIYAPNNRITYASLFLTIASWLPSFSGTYTLTFSWQIPVYLFDCYFDWVSYTTHYYYYYRFTLTGEYSLTFNY